MKDYTCYVIPHRVAKWTFMLWYIRNTKVFADYQMPEGHTSRPRSNKQYGALSARMGYSRKI